MDLSRPCWEAIVKAHCQGPMSPPSVASDSRETLVAHGRQPPILSHDHLMRLVQRLWRESSTNNLVSRAMMGAHEQGIHSLSFGGGGLLKHRTKNSSPLAVVPGSPASSHLNEPPWGHPGVSAWVTWTCMQGGQWRTVLLQPRVASGLSTRVSSCHPLTGRLSASSETQPPASPTRARRSPKA